MHQQFDPITGRKIKVALIGCGRIANKHLEAIDKHQNDLELVAVCDARKDRLAETTDKYNVTGYSRLTDVLDKAKPDMVVLATPSGLHPAQTILAAEAGAHVMTEKPMATRWKDGLRMVEVCDKLGVKLFVVKQNRRNATLQLLKNAVKQKRFGRIYMVNINVFWSRPQAYYDQDAWRGTWEFDGGALMNQASHYVDLLDWLIGPIESVQAYTGTLARDIQVEDTAVMNIRWRSGALGSMNVTMLTYPKNYEGSITIIGEKGTVRVGGVAVNEIQTWEFEDDHPDDKHIKTANYETTSVYGFGHPLYYDNVIKTLRGEADAETDGREGLHSLEVLIAAYLSARDGKRVSLPLEY
jgi:UDP-N-acetyl-2-amino-2-deoxyglucuronate dehydrogenase